MTSKDGQWLEGGEFPLPLGSNASLRKSNRGKPIDRTLSKFCDVVHLDIAFGDCVSIGGFRYALVFVDRATRYNWVFGLRSLSSDCIKSAFLKFRSAAGRYATQFRCDCDKKLFGTAIKEFSSIMTRTLLLRRLAGNPLMGLWRVTGRQWFTCLGLISLRSKCLGPFGSSQFWRRPDG